jgi:hypothetical protein
LHFLVAPPPPQSATLQLRGIQEEDVKFKNMAKLCAVVLTLINILIATSQVVEAGKIELKEIFISQHKTKIECEKEREKLANKNAECFSSDKGVRFGWNLKTNNKV